MDKSLFDLYRSMYLIRAVEETIAKYYNAEIRQMHTPVHLCNGQEAIAVGVCSNLTKDDVVFSNHRCHGHYLAKGGDLIGMIAELHNKSTGCCKGKGGSMHLCDLDNGIMLTSAIVAGNVSVATGYAMAQKMKGSTDISVAFFGDGASEEGNVYESISFSVMKNLPILFVCENNRYAISTPYSLREPCNTISEKFKSMIETLNLDGNDVESVSNAARNAISKIRAGNGPILIECNTYRLKAHSNTGDGIDNIYRMEDEVKKARENDPLRKLRSKILDNELISKRDLEHEEQNIQNSIENAFVSARNAPLPLVEELFADVY